MVTPQEFESRCYNQVMIDSQGLEEHAVEETRPEVTVFKEQIAKVDGTLLPLRKTTADGKRLYITARHLRNPWEFYKVDTAPGYYDVERRIKEGADTTANTRFYGWEEDRIKKGTPHMTGTVLIDTYLDNEGKIVPFGHMDWWLSGDYANGGGNMHDASIPQGEHEKLAAQQWGRNEHVAFKVDYNHHQQGVGSLMLAASAVVLPAIGMKTFFSGALLDPAKKTYNRFGIKESDFSPLRDPRLPIDRLSQHPQVDRTISEFV